MYNKNNNFKKYKAILKNWIKLKNSQIWNNYLISRYIISLNIYG